MSAISDKYIIPTTTRGTPAMIRHILVALLAGLLVACGGGEERENPLPMIGEGLPYDGYPTIEEMIALSDVVARVSIASVTAEVETSARAWHNSALIYTFTVHEYLKGSGGNTLVGVVGSAGLSYSAEAGARADLAGISAARPTQWDDRQAIVFMYKADHYPSTTSNADRYLLGHHYYYGEDGYTVASRHYKGWLPAAEAAARGPRSTNNDSVRFLTDLNPSGGTATGSKGGEGNMITLGELKSKVNAIKAEIDAGDGSEAYADCVHTKYYTERIYRYYATNKPDVKVLNFSIDSGLASGTVVDEDRLGSGRLPDKVGRYWLEGPDKNYFAITTHDPVPYSWAGDGTVDRLRYTRRITTTRPLAAGSYTYQPNGMSAARAICNLRAANESAAHSHNVTVTAPTGTLHEAFFDPGAAGGTVGFSPVIGSLEPAGFTLGGAATAIGRPALAKRLGGPDPVALRGADHLRPATSSPWTGRCR